MGSKKNKSWQALRDVADDLLFPKTGNWRTLLTRLYTRYLRDFIQGGRRAL